MIRLVFPLLFLLFAQSFAKAEKGDCIDGAATIGRSAMAMARESEGRLLALKKAMPAIEDPENFAAQFRARRAAWRVEHPNDAANFPVPQHASAIEELKSLLPLLAKDPDYGYRDATSFLLTKNAREKATRALLARIESVEARGYPNHDTIKLADDILDFLRRVDPRPKLPNGLAYDIKQKLGIKIVLPDEVEKALARQFELLRADFSEARPANLKEYENAMIAAFQKQSDVMKIKINVRGFLRRQSSDAGFAQKIESNIVRSSLGNGAMVRGPVILSVGDMSTRALIEAVIFEIEPAGIITRKIRAEHTLMGVSRYFNHDFNHMAITRKDPVSQQLIGRTADEKHALFASIDSIADGKQREIAENLVMLALRDGPSGGMWTNLFSKPHEKLNATELRTLAGNFEHLSGIKISDDEAKWINDWWRAHLPIPELPKP